MSLIKITNDKSDLFIEGVFYSKIFNKEIEIFFEPEVDMEYAEKCVEHFNSISDSMIDDFCEMAIRYCEFMRHEWGEFGYDDIVEEIQRAIPQKVQGRSIFKFISEPKMFIMEPEEEVPGYSIECNCIWEPEHGLDWIIRDNKNLYAGPVSGLGAWCNDEEYKCVY